MRAMLRDDLSESQSSKSSVGGYYKESIYSVGEMGILLQFMSKPKMIMEEQT